MNTCPICKENRKDNQYCTQVYTEKGSFCVIQENYSATLVYRSPGQEEQPVSFLSGILRKSTEDWKL